MPMLSLLKRIRTDRTSARCSAVIAAAGTSSRMGGEDKLFIDINGKPVLAHALGAFEACSYIDEIIIVSRHESISLISDICKEYSITKAAKIIFGGDSRLKSVLNGVLAVSDTAELIAIHDGARPCIELEIIIETINAAKKHHAAAPAIPITSTVKKVRNNTIIETVDRSDLYEIQTPQVFDADLIKAALTNADNKSIDVTDDCRAVELIGGSVHITSGSRSNIKLTTGEDIAIARSILEGG